VLMGMQMKRLPTLEVGTLAVAADIIIDILVHILRARGHGESPER
jgi:hypothetical protein